MRSRVSGVSDYLTMDERDAIRFGREIVGNLNWRKLGSSKRVPVEDPVYDPNEILGIASIDVRVPFDVKEGAWHERDPYGERLAATASVAFEEPSRASAAPTWPLTWEPSC